MVEIRIVSHDDTLQFQQRTRTITVVMIGDIAFSEWSEWEPIPMVVGEHLPRGD